MIVTAKQRTEAGRIADTDWWLMRWLTPDERQIVADQTVKAYEEFDGDFITARSAKREMQEQAYRGVAGFITIGFVLSVIIGWGITKILDYLLSQVTSSPENISEND